jgi:uncharacterized protein YkwD
MECTHRVTKVTGLTALLFSLAACGGGSAGGGASSPSPNSAPPSAPVNTTAPSPAYTDSVRTGLFETINAERLKAGLGALTQSTALDTAAGYHSNYLLLNPTTAPNDVEDEGNPGYVEDDPYTRGVDAGFDGGLGSSLEVLAADVAVGNDAALTMLAAPYHRVFLLGQAWTQMGWGFVPNADGVATLVGEVGLPRSATAQGMTGSASFYPVANASDVSVMMPNEQPEYALPAAWGSGAYPGYPVSVQLPLGDGWTPGTFTLAETASGAQVVGTVLDNSSQAMENYGIHNWSFFVPSSPLKPATSYTATFTATVQSQAFSKTWSFTTRAGQVILTNVPAGAVSVATETTVNVKSPSLVQAVGGVALSSQCGAAVANTVASPGSIKLKMTGAVASGCAATVIVNDVAYPSETASFTVNFTP